MPPITPHLWYDTQAREAGEFYVSLFPNSRVKKVVTLRETPSGNADVVAIELAGQPFQLISAGPYFKFTPAISFLVFCDSKEEVDRLWNELSKGGQALMELGEYPFSERFGWTQDRFGLSWQLIYTREPIAQKITPTLMYVGDVAGRAEEAMQYYTSVFPNSDVLQTSRYGAGEEPDREGTIRHASFTLDGKQFAAMDSAHAHQFTFNEAVSLMVQCKDQEEIDYYWSKLSTDVRAEQCGWCKDQFGVSWQVTPIRLGEMLASGNPEQVARVTQAFLQMKKFDIAALETAFAG